MRTLSSITGTGRSTTTSSTTILGLTGGGGGGGIGITLSITGSAITHFGASTTLSTTR